MPTITEPGLEPGIDMTLEPGLEPGIDMIFEPGLEPGIDMIFEPGFEPGIVYTADDTDTPIIEPFTCTYPNAQPTYRKHSWKSRERNIYDNFTIDQINQRRKEEILQYKKNSNPLTKAQQMANSLRGNRRFRKALAYQRHTNTVPREVKSDGSTNMNNTMRTNPNAQNLPIKNNSLVVPNQSKCKSTVENVPLRRYNKRYQYT